jgi:hypothetical protein
MPSPVAKSLDIAPPTARAQMVVSKDLGDGRHFRKRVGQIGVVVLFGLGDGHHLTRRRMPDPGVHFGPHGGPHAGN